MIVLVACLLLFAAFFVLLYKLPNAKNVPGPPPLPLFGNTLDFPWKLSGMTKLILDWYKIYGSPMRVMVGPFCLVHLFRADHVEAILKSTVNIRKGRMYEMIECWLGTGLLTSKGEKWHKRRKMLTPAFHYQILRDYLPIINEEALELVEYFKKHATSEPIDICRPICLNALDIICETAMGTKLHALQNSNSLYVSAISRVTEIILLRVYRPWLWPDIYFWNFTSLGREFKTVLSTLHNFTNQVIEEREKEQKLATTTQSDNGNGKSKRRKAFLDLLLELKSDNELGIEDIREEVDTFMFEGHDTTSAAVMWALYCLGRHPGVQSRCQEEIDEILGKDGSAVPSIEQLTEMKYLDCCIKESQRLYPTVPLVTRRLEEPLQLDDKCTLPRGVMINISFYGLHRDPDHFPDPEVYDPDRFLPENSIGRHPFAFVPFAAGPRNCIGQKFAQMEEKVILSQLLRNFTMEATQEPEDMQPTMTFVLRPSNGVWLKLKPR